MDILYKKCAPDLQKIYIQNDIIFKNEFNALTKVFEDQTKNDVSKSIMDYDNEATKFIFSEIKNIFIIQESSNIPKTRWTNPSVQDFCKEVAFKNIPLPYKCKMC